MDSKDLTNMIRESTRAEKTTPSTRAWLKLEHKLDRRRYNKRIRSYRQLAVAAVGLFVISVTILLTITLGNFDSNDADLAKVVPNQTGYRIQNLPESNDPTYNSARVHVLYAAYDKAFKETVSPEEKRAITIRKHI